MAKQARKQQIHRNAEDPNASKKRNPIST